MKMIRSLLPTLILGVFLLGAVTASAQRGTPNIAPDKQWGVGVYGGGTSSGAGISGQYAISPSLIIGLGAGFGGRSDSNSSNTDYSGDLFGRFLFEGTLNPFIQAGFRTVSSSQSSTRATITTTTTEAYNGLYLGLGLQYFFNHNVGVFSMFELVSLDLGSNTHAQNTFYGVRNARVGLEWYFNP